MENQAIHWADQLAEKIIARAEKERIVPNIKCQQTPSGGKHIGNLNDVARAYLVYKSILTKNQKCTFVHTTDDRDPMKEVPKRINDLNGKWYDSEKLVDFGKYMGVPYCRIPDPFNCCKNWSEHFTKVWMKGVNILGMFPELYSVNKLYEEGKFDPYIELVFKNAKIAGEITAQFQSTKSEEYIPFDSICPKCGKLTNIDGFDLTKKTVHFTCTGKTIKKGVTEGCGFIGEVPWREGKLQWRFEWPALMCIFNTTYEPMGKDHWEGSWKSAIEIMKRIYKKEPPIPFVYEFFLVNGQKMSASKGEVYIVQDMLKFLEPEVFLFFYAKRPEKQRDLELKNIFQLVDEFDLSERIYFGKEEGRTENREENSKRMYELTMDEIPERCPIRVSYTFAANISQLYSNDIAIEKLKELGHLKDADENDIELNKRRLILANYWVKNYAPEEMRFSLQEVVPEDIVLNEKQKLALKKISEILKNKKWEEKELHAEFYNISKELDLKLDEFFKAAYLVLIKKEKGPRLANFILTIGQEKVSDLFSKV